MGRKVDVEELVGTSEIAERLGISHAETVLNWRERHESFPVPVAKVGRAHIWAWPDVERWARETGRLAKKGARLGVNRSS
jgi:hypothetical protein